LVLLVSLVFNTIFNAVRINLLSFENSALRLLRKTEKLSKKAQTFDEKKALMKLGMNNINGFCYRFDEHINEAICENDGIGKAKVQKEIKGFSFEFNGDDAVKFKPKKGKFILEGGLLKFEHTIDEYLQNVGDLNIVKDSIGEIELRIKLKKAKEVKLGWSKYSYAKWWDWRETGTITIYTHPDDKFHIYRINTKDAFKNPFYLKHGDRIKKVFLLLSDATNDKVEIDYIRFIPKREKYSRKLYDETYETIDKQRRKVLYINTPLCLRYVLDIPEGEPFLKFGMGILEENDPVKFRVMVKRQNLQKVLFSREIINADEWHDAKIDLSNWSGKSVEILFQTDSTKGNIAFWSNPVIYTPAKQRLNVIIVLEDALRADHMSCYGYFRETTPVKDKFIKNGVLFLNAFSQTTKTGSSCPTIMTSLYSTATGVWSSSDMLDCKYLTLAEIMRSQGFATASFILNGNAGAWNGLHQGFSNLFDVETIGWRAEKIYGGKKLYEWLESNIDRNFFIYLHLLDPHCPYNPPPPFDSWYRQMPLGNILLKKLEHVDPKWIKAPTLEGRRLLYDGEIRYNDFYFERFLEKLREYKLLHDTLIIFIADHGEHLGEHGLWSHNPPGYIQVLHVPLLMVYPKRLPKDVKIIQPVQLIDIMPTVLELANIDKVNLLIEGDSLLPLVHGERLRFWSDRLCISEEVSLKKNKDDKNEWASVFYKNWHIINSKELKDGLSKLMGRFSQRNTKFSFTMRVFDYFKDKEEKRYMNSFLLDPFFRYRIKRFMRQFQENNMAIWKALTKHTKEIIRYDPEELERLRALGYLQ